MTAVGFTLDLRRAQHGDVAGWATKTSALSALNVLRSSGLNADRDIEVHRAETHLCRFWVIPEALVVAYETTWAAHEAAVAAIVGYIEANGLEPRYDEEEG